MRRLRLPLCILTVLCLCLTDTRAAQESSAITFIISGNVGASGVRLQGSPGTVVSDARGYYEFEVESGWSGSIIPTKEGYRFSPESRIFGRLVASRSKQDFTAATLFLKISGNVGTSGALLLGSPNGVISDARGYYLVKVKQGWKGVLTPLKEGYVFEPSSRSYDDLEKNCSSMDYAAKILHYKVSGSVGLPGVVLRGLPGNPITDAKGHYSVVVDYAWTGLVKPHKEGYSFVPASRRYVKIREDEVDENYQSAPISFIISGNTSVPGVILKGLPGNPTTGDQGKYKVEVPDGWCGIVVPYRQGYSFEPSSRKYPCVRESMPYENYLGKRDPVTISGSILIDGNPVSGVRVTADNRGGFDITDAQGCYRVTVPHGWSGNLSPIKEGWFFSPAKMPYKDVTENIDNRKKPTSPQPSYRLGSDAKVLIVPISKIAPNEFDHLVQDTNVMLHILRKNINKDQAGAAGGVFSDFDEFLGQSNCPFKAIYIQDYGILFSLEVEMPMAPPAPPSESSTAGATPQDSIWQRAQRELHQAPQTSMRMAGAMPQTLDPDEVVMDLIVLLRHASNIRHLEPDDRIIVTLLGKSPTLRTKMMGGAMGGYGGGGGGMGGYGGGMMRSKKSTAGVSGEPTMMGGGMGEYGYDEDPGADSTNPANSASLSGPSMMGGMGGMMGSDGGGEGVGTEMMGGYGMMREGMGMEGYGGGMMGVSTIQSDMGGMGFPAAPFVTTVVTVHVKKSAVDAFAQGKIDFKQFRKSVQVFKY
jgi:hypothetical protein